ncbi:hypothetical protein F5Y16DRAFT_332 [Xylariaceae sp. FL0255]|nr:hypothetical protein F5Y16DRAFT_332 [Xylariaceae sp. FL0255]
MPESGRHMNLERQPQGYHRLAQFMSQRNSVVLKRFQKLAILDLLYLQAELCHIQDDLEKQAFHDANEKDSRQFFDRDWWHLHYAEQLGLDGRQGQLVLKMRTKLREFYTAVQLYQSVASAPNTTEQQRKGLYAYAYNQSAGGFCDFLGRDLGNHAPYESVFSAHNRHDLLFVGQEQPDNDLVSKLLSGPALKALHHILRHFKKPLNANIESGHAERSPSSLYYYSDQHVQFALAIIGSVLSSTVPTASIVVLFFVKDMLARLGLVTLFTFIFSLVLCLATNAKRYEIFAATAAFASVQVVFVGTTSGSPQ